MRPLFLLAGILGGAVPLLAQVAAAQAPIAQTPDPQTFQDHVVVTASLEETERDELPQAVTVLDRATIEARQASEALDLLATVPGISVVQSGSAGSVTSLFSRGANSNQSLVLWNGVPLNDPFFGGYDWAFLGTEDLERIEVVRGPLSTLYGSNAIGGTIQLLTAKQQGLRLRLEAGDQKYWRGAVAGGWGSGPFHGSLVATSRSSDGPQVNETYDGDEILGRGEWISEEGHTLSLLGRYQDSDLGIPQSGGQATPRRRQGGLGRSLTLVSDGLRSDWHWNAQVSAVADVFRFRDPDAFFSLNDTSADRRQARGAVTHGSSRGTAGFGAEWRRDEVSNVSTFGVNLDGARQISRAAFGELRWRGERWALTTGLRHDEHESFGSETSPAVGLTLRLGDGSLLRGSYGEAFRAPSLGELFFPFSGNPALKAETSRSSELSFEHRRGPWWLVIAAFETRQDNLIQFDLVTFTNENLGKARIRGLESSFGVRRGAWRGEINATFLDAENSDTGEALLRRPDETVNLLVGYQASAWSLHLTTRFVGERPDVDPVTFAAATNPSYLRLDLAGRWQASAKVAPFLRVENLADEEYDEALGFPAPGRTWIGGVALGL